MATPNWHVIFILLFLGQWGSLVSCISTPVQEEPNVRHRQLRAASRQSDLLRRDQGIRRTFTANLVYTEFENTYGGESVFASRIQIESDVPILVLEDIEHHLNGVECTDSAIKLSFENKSGAEAVRHACHHENGSYAITSHITCNSEESRSVFKIDGITLSDDGVSLVMQASRTPWKQAFRTFDIDFGYTDEPHSFRHRSNILRRQNAPSTTTAVITAQTIPTASHTATSIPTVYSAVSVPTITIPTLSATATSLSINLATQILNSTFHFPIEQIQKVPVNIGCKNCTTTGQLVLTQGTFKIDINPFDGTPFHFISGGNVQLQANGVSAHIELISIPSGTATYSHDLFSIPVVGFVIPELGQAGITFTPSIIAHFQISGGVEFTYGFDIQVPTGSYVNVDFGDLSNSSVKGFDAATITALPFQANTTDITLTVQTALRPTIPIGFSFDNDDFTVQVAVFLDLPSVSAVVSPQSHTDASCVPLNSTNATLPTDKSISSATLTELLAQMGDLTLIEPTVEIDVAFGGNFKAAISPLPNVAFGTSTTLLSTTFALPTACLAWSSGFTPATAMLAQLTSSVLASSASASSASAASASAAAAASSSEAAKASASATKHSGVGGRPVPGWTGNGGAWETAVLGLIGVAVGFVRL